MKKKISDALSNAKKDFIGFKNKNASKSLEDVAKNLWVISAAGAADFSEWLSSTAAVRSLNKFSSEVSKAMDESFRIGSIDSETGLKMMPNNHRILDGGHSLATSFQKASEIGQEQGWSDSETFIEWGKAYFSDLSSPAGMPAFGNLSDNIYEFLRNTAGVEEAVARDFVTVNGQEFLEAMIGGTLSAVSLVFAWKKEDKENFSRAIGSIGLSGIMFMNPVTAGIAIVGLAFGYNKLVCKHAAARGGMITGAGLVVSAIFPGPLLLGIVPAIVASSYLNKKLDKNVPPHEQVKKVLLYLASDDFQKNSRARFEHANEWLQAELKKARGTPAACVD